MANYGDRFGYQRFSMFPPVIKWLMLINITIFILGYLPAGMVVGIPVNLEYWFTRYGALWPINMPVFGIWQYISYMFLHGGFLHIFFNMLVLWMFGLELEQVWGSKRFLIFYFLCGIGAGIIHSIVTLMIGQGAPTIGASGAIMGVMIAFGLMFPDRLVFALFIPMRAKYAVLLMIGIDLYNGVISTSDGIAHFAHLGGALLGYIILKTSGLYLRGGIFKKVGQQTQPPMDTFRTMGQQPQAAPPRGRVIDVNFREVPRNAPPVMNFGDDQERIDAILDKISREGYQNLTEEEKALLIHASKKLR